jgi:hypothetical protein
MVATATFTDSNISNPVAVAPASLTVTAGGPAIYTITVNFGGNSTVCNSPLSVSGLPVGASASFSPSTVAGAGGGQATSAMTISTTGAGPTTTPGGTHPFVVTAGLGTGCDGAARTANGTLVVQPAGSVDGTAPVVTSVMASPTPTNGTAAVVLTATATDAESNIQSAEYNIDGAGFIAMTATDGAFDELAEDLTATIAAAVIAALTDGTHTLCVRATDVAGNTSMDAVACTTILVDKTSPVVSGVSASPNPTNGSAAVVLTATATDALTDVTSAEYNIDGGAFMAMSASDGAFDELSEGVTVTIAAAAVAALTDGNHTLCVRATDAVSNTSGDADACTTLVVDQTPPAVSGVSATPNPVANGTSTVLSATITDALTNVVSAQYSTDGGGSWNDFPAFTAGLVVDVSKTLSLPTGVYNLCVRGTDAAGNTSVVEACTLLAVYDPSAGFVTGGGWIDSPAGAYAADPGLTGKASFGFVSKYKKGATVPDGNTEFQFHAAGFKFQSTVYEWLVVAGSKAQFKGDGKVNGNDGYRFILTAVDGDRKPDTFRIKIWGLATGTVVYDNQMGLADTGDPATTLAGGSIVIHAK